MLAAPLALAQFSPGPLARAHQSLDSLSQCTGCHAVGSGAPQFKCLDCHQEIRQRLAGRRGYHARVVDTSKPSQDCIRCHTDHVGRDFPIITWPGGKEAFDHRETGYPLQGRHAAIECARCHKKEFIPSEELRTFAVKDASRTFLGLSQDCLRCHPDAHRGQLGSNCLNCHAFDAWKQTPGFDHAKTRFPLTGLHQKTLCEQCHRTAGSPPVTQYAGLRFDTCAACHQDPHGGAFRGSCQSCHTTGGWKQISRLPGFDHARTRFPLAGKHAAVACAACHRNADFSRPLAHAQCLDCHAADDPHRGQFRHQADGGDCSFCHTEAGFTPSTFTLDRHQTTPYPLLGKHRQVQCDQCHVSRQQVVQYRLPHDQCRDCHSDVHDGQFDAQPFFGRCEGCHSVDGFHPSTFTLALHQESRFPLRGAHVAVMCSGCHKPSRAAPDSPALFRFADRSCTACHPDPHQGQFASPRTAATLHCASCHTEDSWQEMTRYNHAATGFPLLGAHRTTACRQCHLPDPADAGIQAVTFSLAPRECGGCHEDAHAGQFASQNGFAPCANCHTETSWEPTRFDHNRGTSFSLIGQHETVPCEDCHARQMRVADKSVVIYKGTPHACADCHSN